MPRLSHVCLSCNDQKTVPDPPSGTSYYLILEHSLCLAGPHQKKGDLKRQIFPVLKLTKIEQTFDSEYFVSRHNAI